jgi:16S rRNA (guanine966-N2)-methyltransferase
LRGEIDVCSAAPPYPDDLNAIFQALLDSGCVRPGGRYVFQHPTGRVPALLVAGAPAPTDLRRYGSNALTIVRVAAAADGSTTDPRDEPRAS